MRFLKDRYLAFVTIFFLISLIRSDYDFVIWITGTILLILGIVSYFYKDTDKEKNK